MTQHRYFQKVLDKEITDERTLELINDEHYYKRTLFEKMEQNNFYEDLKNKIRHIFLPYTDEKIYIEIERDKYFEQFNQQVNGKKWRMKSGQVMLFLWQNEVNIIFWSLKNEHFKLPFIWFDNTDQLLTIITSIVRNISHIFVNYMTSKSNKIRDIKRGVPVYETNEYGEQILLNPDYKKQAEKVAKQKKI